MSGVQALLAGEDLVVEADGRRILDVDRLELREGEILAVLGPNGSGKSTLLRVLALLQRPHGGRVTFRGDPTIAAERDLRRSLAMVFQRPHLWAGTVRSNIELGLRLRGVPREARGAAADAAAELLQVSHLLGARAEGLSTGEVQRVAIARALALEPGILILDEPTASLDAEVRTALREDLERVARTRSRSTVIATHDRAEAFYVADRIAVLNGGRVVQVGTPSELFENPAESYIATVTGAEFSVRGTVTGAEDGLLHVRIGDRTFTAVGAAAPGDEVKVAYRPEDLFLSRESIAGASPRNRFPARIVEIRALGGLLRLRLLGPAEMVAVVTRAAGDELELREGLETQVQVKATALHAFPL